MTDSEAPASDPELPLPRPEEFAELSDQQLAELVRMVESAERQVRQRMAPFQHRLNKLAADAAVIATEVRRRERQGQIQSRRLVREQVKEGQAPSLAQLVAQEEPPEFGEPDLAELTFLLESGGEVALGYPGSRTASLQMTDGRTVATVSTLAESRELYRQGWEFGVPARRGVRVHTPGTRLERLLDPEKCFVRPRAASTGKTPASP